MVYVVSLLYIIGVRITVIFILGRLRLNISFERLTACLYDANSSFISNLKWHMREEAMRPSNPQPCKKKKISEGEEKHKTSYGNTLKL